MYHVHQHAKNYRGPASDEESDAEDTGRPLPGLFGTPVRNALSSLRNTSASFLVTSSPIQSTSQLTPFAPVHISPKKRRYSELLDAPATSELERELQEALRAEQDRNAIQKKQLVMMQSTLVLNGAYCDLVRGQLEAQEKSRAKKQKGRLVQDGLPRLLTARDFVDRVVHFQQAAETKEQELEKRRATRAERADAMKEWKALEATRKEANKGIREQHVLDVKAWEVERARAKALKQRPRWNKPKVSDKLFPPIPRPTFIVAEDPEADGDDDLDGRGASSSSSEGGSTDGSSE
ncbi:hypothetical protein C8J57DRAFT_1069587 [Mycena rebaudengoi]|nr:hypothetical protein C8J57DRAFT_1069587 [Mycena rebaudengoi]